MDKLDKKIGIIGMGHMGKALKAGLQRGGFKKENILISNSSKTNKNVVKNADWIILAVKPSIVHEIVEEIRGVVKDKLLISVAAAVSISSIEKWAANKNQKIIRIMPNIAVKYNQSATGLFANRNVLKKDKQEVVKLMSGLGKVFELKNEQDIDIFTVIAACNPAVVAYFSKLLSEYGETNGLSAKQSEEIVMQAFKGTNIYQEKSDLSVANLIQSVATKGGVTEEIIKDFDKEKISLQIHKSLDKGFMKINKAKKDMEK